MKLSSNTGLVKSKDAEIKSAMFDEFDERDNIVRINQRFVDMVDNQFSMPKLEHSDKELKEINRFDGNKIFIGKNSNEEIEISDNKEIVKPLIYKNSNGSESLFTYWNIEDISLVEDAPIGDTIDEQILEESLVSSAAPDEFSISNVKGISKEIIENAKKEAELIKQKAETESAEIRSQAYREGYEEGFARVNTEIETLRTIQKNLQSLNEEIIKSSETKIVELIKLITVKMFANGLALDATMLRDVVARAINEASRLGNVKVYLNPEDLDKLKKLWRESELDYNGQKIQLASNADILPGGCFVEGDFGSVDARVDTQMKSVLNTMEEIQLDQTAHVEEEVT